MTITVTQLGNFLKAMVDSETLLYDLNVEGEVSNLRLGSEVAFFVLKDDNAQINCFWYSPKINFFDGDKVVVSGRPNFYVKGGNLSFAVSNVKRKDKKGDSFLAFLQLKEKFEKEGLFDLSRKKPIVKNCKKLGVVTSLEGAVMHDIHKVCNRRDPSVDIIVYDCRVQGAESEKTIIDGIKYFQNTDVDNIIVARGGGSAEDLSSFNGEKLVYAIADSKKPVISAVGHETDFTLCDFVADARAATPSVAAEICTRDTVAFRAELTQRLKKCAGILSSRISENYSRLKLYDEKLKMESTSLCDKKQAEIKNLFSFCQVALEKKFLNSEAQVKLLLARLDGANPLNILKKGYSVAEKDGKKVFSAKQLKKSDKVEVVFFDGRAKVTVDEMEN